jgi:hypothetical protein
VRRGCNGEFPAKTVGNSPFPERLRTVDDSGAGVA